MFYLHKTNLLNIYFIPQKKVDTFYFIPLFLAQQKDHP